MGSRRIPDHPPPGLRAEIIEIAGEAFLIASYPEHEKPAFQGLSAAEAAVLNAALNGFSNAEIALARNRSVHTIQHQLASALRKLGLTTRAEAAALLAGRTRR